MIKNIFSQILDRKRKAMAQLRADPASQNFRECALEVRKNAKPNRLLRALTSDSPRLKIIAEFKRRSPSAGIIRDDLSASQVAHCYKRGGACAISVLTDHDYFGGFIDDLITIRSNTDLPLLRKDFTIDPIQIYQAAAAGADAVLLIAAALDDSSLGELRKIAEDELGLDALVEVHTSEELRRALNGGLQSPDALLRLRKLGFRGFLIGEALMRASNPETALRNLIAAAEDREVALPATRQP
ncbi:MAG: indole-3-glycerol-phosphate synthase TrpC [Verrucomicrobia bacterium]|nr:MAG: indole-3-glycerol-phosphate synthase TrpC [Verrucomicrobiota bacterium]